MSELREHLLKLWLGKDRKWLAFYIIALLLIIWPLLGILLYIIHYSVNVPWWDQVSFVGLMSKLHNGTLSVYDLWMQHNEHRILVPQVLELVVGEVSRFNFRAPVLLNWVTATASFGFLLSMLKRTFMNLKLIALLAVMFAWLMFSPIQYINWIWGFQLAFFMSVFFTIGAIWLLTYRNVLTNWWLLVLAIALAGTTTYCNGNGLLVWPLGLGILLLRRADRKRLGVWTGAALVFIGSYLYKFHRDPQSPKFSTIIREPVAVVKYALAYLGRNLAVTPISARYVGFVLLVILATAIWYIYRKGKMSNIISWLALAVFVILTGVLAAISRLNFGVNHGFISNSYPTISLLFILATLAITVYALVLWVGEFNKRHILSYLLVFFMLGALFAYPLPAFFANFSAGKTDFQLLGEHLRLVQQCVYTAKSPKDNCLLIIYPDKQTSWQYIQTLKQLKWGDFKNLPGR